MDNVESNVTNGDKPEFRGRKIVKAQGTLAKGWVFTVPNYEDRSAVIDDELCEYRIQGYEIGEKGTPHIQGYVLLKKECRFTALKKIHPTAHWEKAKGSSYQNFLYCSKGEQPHPEWEEFKEQGPTYGENADIEEFGQRPTGPQKKQKCRAYNEALAAKTVAEGLNIIKEKRARDYCLHGESIARNLKNAKIEKYISKYVSEDFLIPLQQCYKPILLYGDSNIGKTAYAAAHFNNPLFLSHIDKLKDLSPDHDGIIFDDMRFTHWPTESVIHLLDMENPRSIHVRYGIAMIPAGIPRIFTHNDKNPFYDEAAISDAQKAAIERRLNRVHIQNDIRRPKKAFVDMLQSTEASSTQDTYQLNLPISQEEVEGMVVESLSEDFEFSMVPKLPVWVTCSECDYQHPLGEACSTPV